jgi:hypothetical protein
MYEICNYSVKYPNYTFLKIIQEPKNIAIMEFWWSEGETTQKNLKNDNLVFDFHSQS